LQLRIVVFELRDNIVVRLKLEIEANVTEFTKYTEVELLYKSILPTIG